MAIAIVVVFIIGYLGIAFEDKIHLNKAATALLTGVLCWTIYIISADSKEIVTNQLAHHLGELSQILFFLMGAMTIVELIDAHDGFDIITSRIKTDNKRSLLWIIGFVTFLLSAVLDNLTTAIVMVSLVRKIVAGKNDRMMLAGIVVIAANAGGAWSPIGDVTTTMLWIGNQLTATNIILKLLIPSLFALIVPLLVVQFYFKGKITRHDTSTNANGTADPIFKQRNVIFFAGLIILLLVPVFKVLTHLPPFMGILAGLAVIWIITEIMHGGKDIADRKVYTVAHALQKIDTPSILFFLGILLSVAALQSTGQLIKASAWMNRTLGNEDAIAISIGAFSSLVDNVPLVAAAQGMYSLDTYPTDHSFWEFLAYTTGTGGSMLIIGSAAGIAAMGIEKIAFTWYLKNIGWLALIGFLAGALVYLGQRGF